MKTPRVIALRLVLLLVPFVWTPTGHGQSPEADPMRPSPYGYLVQVSLEPQLVVSIAYARRLTPEGSRSSAGLGAGIRFPPYTVADGSVRANLTAVGEWMPHRAWGTTVTSHAFLARGRNRAGTVHGLGLELRAAPGYHADAWSAAADLGWQGTLLSHIEHSEAARESFDERYPDGTPGANGPSDGWYRSTAHRLRIGFAGSRRLTRGMTLQVTAGSLFSLQRQGILVGFAHGQVPVYLETSVRMRR
jgi:hypothetical protein